MGSKKKISVITPCFNEEGNIKSCYEAVKEIFDTKLHAYEYEHIFCDNNSKDLTLKVLRDISKNDKNVKVIVNSRNFGGPNSMFNGVISASGDAIIPMLPADLQDPPELIIDFIGHWENGYHVIFGVRAKREESLVMRYIRTCYYKLISKFAGIYIPLNSGDFGLIDKKIQNILKNSDDYSPYLRGMIANCGFDTIEVPYTWKARKWGSSKFNIYSLVDIGLNGLISFSNLPMRLCMFFGFFISLASILYALFLFIKILAYPSLTVVSGIPTIIIALFLFSGINLFFLGLLGEYITAIHSQVRKKPLVIEKERINFD
jgi:glycosyltransferase involved in cell wall biosynthesis